jgi:hypothetical protein
LVEPKATRPTGKKSLENEIEKNNNKINNKRKHINSTSCLT